VATGNAVLVIVFHLLSDPAVRFRDLGADHFDTRIDKHRRARNLATQLQALTGQKITIRGGKAVIAEPEAA
jgi:transposase